MNYLFTKISFEEYTEPISEELKKSIWRKFRVV